MLIETKKQPRSTTGHCSNIQTAVVAAAVYQIDFVCVLLPTADLIESTNEN